MIKRAAVRNSGFYRFRRFEEPEDIFLEDLRGACWKSNMLWSDLAEAADLNARTINRFANGDTRRPTFHTIFKLCHALGMRLVRSSNVVPIANRRK